MRTRGAAMKGKTEGAEQSPGDDGTQQTPVHDFDVPASGLDATKPSLELQHGQFGQRHGEDGEDCGGVRKLLVSQNSQQWCA